MRLLGRYRNPILFLTGAAGLAAGLLMDAVTGERFSFGWTQLFLVIAGSVCVILSPPPVQRALSRQIARSTSETPAALARLDAAPGRLIGYGLWLAAAMSAGEIALRIYEQTTGKRFLNQQYLWNVPVTYTLVLVAAGAVIAAIGRWKSQRAALGALVWVAAFVALSGWMNMAIRGLSAVAALVLAAGVAAQIARLAVRHAYLFERIVGRTRIPLVLAIAGLAVWSAAWPRIREYRATTNLPATAPNAPNVLFIVLDTVRAKSLSLYGYGKQTTPNLDRFAARGATFEHAMATAAWTLPSHGGMFTGRLPHELSAGWKSAIDGTHPMIAEAFAASGYQTGGFVANTRFCSSEFGLARGFAHYDDHRLSVGGILQRTAFGVLVARMIPSTDLRRSDWYASSEEKVRFKDGDEINRGVLNWLGARRVDRPFFAFLNYFDAHAPYFAPTEFGSRFWPGRPRGDLWTKRLDQWTPEEIRELNAAYDGTLASLDHHLGLLFAEMDRRNDLANTIVIITSDHGELFGEHGLMEHANSLYSDVVHVPLVIVHPQRVPSNVRVPQRVSLRDLPETLLDLAGLTHAFAFPGSSLTKAWSDPSSMPTVLLTETDQAHEVYPATYPARKGRMQAIVSGAFHYIRNLGDGREELYDLVSDPDELRNLASERSDALQRHREELARMLVPSVPARTPSGMTARRSGGQ